jgi:hypothetical protein
MKFFEWLKKSRLTQIEAAEILGITPNTITTAKGKGSVSSAWNAFAKIASGEVPAFEWSEDKSSYNQPVIVIDGITYGPADTIRRDGRIAAHVILVWACEPDRSEQDYQRARKFLRYWPEGPQLR